MLNEIEWPSAEVLRDQAPLLLFHKIHCGAVSIEKDKYMTPAHSSKTTRSSQSAQYCGHQTYSDALNNTFSPELFHIGILCLLLWPIPGPQRTLWHSSFSQNTAKSCFVVVVVVVGFFSFKISKFALPGRRFKIEQTTIHRMKERN